MQDGQVEKDRSMKSNRNMSLFTMRGWPASHFATINGSGRKTSRNDQETGQRTCEQETLRGATLALKKQTWEIPRFRCSIVGRTWSCLVSRACYAILIPGPAPANTSIDLQQLRKLDRQPSHAHLDSAGPSAVVSCVCAFRRWLLIFVRHSTGLGVERPYQAPRCG